MLHVQVHYKLVDRMYSVHVSTCTSEYNLVIIIYMNCVLHVCIQSCRWGLQKHTVSGSRNMDLDAI